MARVTRDRERPIPAHPYRDTAVVYGAMAILLVVITWVTGGDVVRSIIVGAFVFVIATAWTSRTFRERIRQRDARLLESAAEENAVGKVSGNGGAPPR